MKKSVLVAVAIAAAYPIAAAAEVLTPISVEIEYDKAELASESGALAELDSIRTQAKDACTSPARFGQPRHVDRDCAEDVAAKAAMKKILLRQEEEGLETAPAFVQAVRIQTADLGQR